MIEKTSMVFEQSSTSICLSVKIRRLANYGDGSPAHIKLDGETIGSPASCQTLLPPNYWSSFHGQPSRLYLTSINQLPSKVFLFSMTGSANKDSL
mmetsp:Transcript_1298/g.2716  ORF Transcript_1298/g.2716 Transcript_1298/m.2716 type:complete len:95 (+) Transcript_1298:597-881(+)